MEDSEVDVTNQILQDLLLHYFEGPIFIMLLQELQYHFRTLVVLDPFFLMLFSVMVLNPD